MKCVACGDSAAKTVFEWKDSGKDIKRMKKCASCGLLYQEPMQTQEELAGLYDEEFFDVYGKHFIEYRKRQFQRDINKINSLKAPPGNLLDVGCAFGLFLVAARSRGWNAFGVDVSRKAAEHARREYELKVVCGTLQEAKFEDGHFDVVTAWDVIEHLPAPDIFLDEIKRVLKTGGIFALRTPNASSLFLKAVRIANKTLGNNFAKIGPRFVHHKYVFTPASLGALLKNKGFEVIQADMELEDIIIVDKPSLMNWLKALAKKSLKMLEFFIPSQRESIVVYARKA